MCIVLAIVRPQPLVGVTSMVVVIVLAEGLLEKYVRRQVMKRRQLASACDIGVLHAAASPKDPQPDRDATFEPLPSVQEDRVPSDRRRV
ncbi:MAG TPA: hypothetical protein VK034_15895 [Enhygromyxa sp.]|nr:hypothetical protein [Enhygromyxa sp.]